MKKSDLVHELASRADLSRSAAARVVDALFGHDEGIIVKALKKQDAVKLGDFGSIVARVRAERAGRNPRTAAEITIPASVGAALRPGQRLKNVLSGGADVNLPGRDRTVAGGPHGSGPGGRQSRMMVSGTPHGASPGGRG